MPAFFITSCGTSIGKTLVTCLLIQQLKAQGMQVSAQKPVMSGVEETSHDAYDILDSLGKERTMANLDAISLYLFKAPLSLHLAAQREGTQIDIEQLIAFSKNAPADTYHLIEGAGGIMVPLTPHYTTADWIKALNIPIILVTGSYLGAISHTLTALITAKAYQIPVQGVVISESEESAISLEEMAETLRPFTTTPIMLVPRLMEGVTAPLLTLLLKPAPLLASTLGETA